MIRTAHRCIKYFFEKPIIAVLFLANCTNSAKIESTPATIIVNSIYWSDGDSGRINSNIKFRLNDIDAAETGGVGAAIGGAKCEQERILGFKAKEWAVEFTRNMPLKLSREHGFDRHGRLIIDLSVDGIDMAIAGVKLGFYQTWPHNGDKSLGPRPQWC